MQAVFAGKDTVIFTPGFEYVTPCRRNGNIGSVGLKMPYWDILV